VIRLLQPSISSLKHDNLVKIKGHWEDEDTINIVEQYIVRGDMLQVGVFHVWRVFLNIFNQIYI
jgi:hypothetical protein